MGPGEKKVAVVLTVVLIALIGLYVAFQPKPPTITPIGASMNGGAPGGQPVAAGTTPQQAAQNSGSCSTTTPKSGGAGGVPTKEYGKKGAKVEILALLPITHGCHVNTADALVKAQAAHPDDIHLKVVDLFGGEGQQLAQQNGGQRALVLINGKSSFELNGKTIKLEYTEDKYGPENIVPIVEQVLKTG